MSSIIPTSEDPAVKEIRRLLLEANQTIACSIGFDCQTFDN